MANSSFVMYKNIFKSVHYFFLIFVFVIGLIGIIASGGGDDNGGNSNENGGGGEDNNNDTLNASVDVNHWHTDRPLCWVWFNLTDENNDDIYITEATVTGPYIGTRHFAEKYGDPNFWSTGGTEYISFTPEQHPLANNEYTIVVTYSDGETQTLTTHIPDVEVDFPTIITPTNQSTIDSLTPTFSWQPPANGRETRYMLELREWPSDIAMKWGPFMDKDVTSIVYDSDQPLSPATEYRWVIYAIDDTIPGTVAGAEGWFTTPSE